MISFSFCQNSIGQYSIPEFNIYLALNPPEVEEDTELKDSFWPNENLKIQYQKISENVFLKSEYLENGKRKFTATINVKDGEVRDGEYTEFYSTGYNYVRSKGMYKDGKKTGIWTMFNEDGTIIECEFRENELNGDYFEYYKGDKQNTKGAIKVKGQYHLEQTKRIRLDNETGKMVTTYVECSIPTGNWLYFNLDGSVQKMLNFN